MYLRAASELGETVRTPQSAVDNAIRRARAQMKAESDRYRANSRQGHSIVGALRDFGRYSL